MGQYYKPVLIKDGEVIIIDGVRGEGFCGAKLMEHSWIGNHFVDSVLANLYNKPVNVIWMGDYADDDPALNNIENGKELYEKVWKDGNDIDIDYNSLNYKEKYLVNHTKMEVLDIAEYIRECTASEGWCVHFLSLLTAVGNGQGGGDYWECNKENVGYWAGDLLELVDNAPDDYKKLDIASYGFVEA